MVERDRAAALALQAHLQDLQAPQGEVRIMDAFDFLACNLVPFDVVFLDPPFAGDDLARACTQLADSASLADEALIYLECPRALNLSFLPADWRAYRSGHAGQVQYHLFHKQPIRQEASAVLGFSTEGSGGQ
jgi:16S rRNA (guanine966-N2)-methyltransferase